MAQNISWLGNTYQNVGYVELPKQTSGYARFDDTTIASSDAAAAADITSGKNAFVNGELITGTNSGGGGGIGTLLKTESLGAISTSSTTAADISHNVAVTGIYDYDLLIVETSVDTKTNNRHAATTRLIFLTADSSVGTKNGTAIATATWNCKLSSNGTATTRSNTTARGIYPYSCTISTTNNGTATLVMYRCYNSTQTGTINGSYTTRVYGVKLYNLIGG